MPSFSLIKNHFQSHSEQFLTRLFYGLRKKVPFRPEISSVLEEAPRMIAQRQGGLCRLALVVGASWILTSAYGLPPDEQTFDTPQNAVDALTTAAKIHDTKALHSIFGATREDLISPDLVEATEESATFVERLTEKTQLITDTDSKISLALGMDGWPFPIPLVKENNKWFFDTEAGKEEILARRIGRDEIGAIDVSLSYVEAQREYASQDRSGDGVLAYAQLLHSTPGKHDGLFWPTRPGENASPFGPLIAEAHLAGYHHTAQMLNDEQAPYHGYYFRILTSQKQSAPGGAYDYIINGNMIAGFALIAWPAEWGNTGVMTFIVNQQGVVYQRNYGSDTSKIVEQKMAYDPTDMWTVAK